MFKGVKKLNKKRLVVCFILYLSLKITVARITVVQIMQ